MEDEARNDRDGAADTGPEGAGRTYYVIARRIVVATLGGTLLVFGAILLLVPGPGLLVLSAGLGVLALEFAWARRWLQRAKESASRMVATSRGAEHPED